MCCNSYNDRLRNLCCKCGNDLLSLNERKTDNAQKFEDFNHENKKMADQNVLPKVECLNCKEFNKSSAAFCIYCGQSLSKINNYYENKRCPLCTFECQDTLNYCPMCNHKFEISKSDTLKAEFLKNIKCNKCEKTIRINSKFCNFCGVNINPDNLDDMEVIQAAIEIKKIEKVIVENLKECPTCTLTCEKRVNFCPCCNYMFPNVKVENFDMRKEIKLDKEEYITYNDSDEECDDEEGMIATSSCIHIFNLLAENFFYK